MSVLNWLFEAEIHFGSKVILWREVLGNAFGLAGAIYGMRRKVWTWPVGMAGNILLFTVFLGAVFNTPQDKNLYGQAGRQVFLILLSIYGWIIWNRNRGKSSKNAVSPRWATTRERLYLFPVVVVFYLISFLLLKELGSWAPIPDAWIFTGTVLATYGMSKGFVEFWLVWIAVDAVGVPLLIKGGYYPSAILYGVYGAFVIWGFVSWLSIASREGSRTGKLEM